MYAPCPRSVNEKIPSKSAHKFSKNLRLYFLDSGFVLDDDDVLQIGLSAGTQLVDPLRSARVQADGELVSVAAAVDAHVIALDVVVEALST